MSREDYHSLLVQQKNEEEKFNDMEKHLKGQTIVDKLSDDFELLFYFKEIKNNLPPPSYMLSMELEFMTREMVSFEYLMANSWMNILKFRMRRLHLDQPPTQP